MGGKGFIDSELLFSDTVHQFLQVLTMTHMVKFHEERYWQKVMSLFCVHSTHSCEANKSRNSEPFFACGRSQPLHRSH